MRPAIHGDAGDVPGGIKASGPEHAPELLSNVALDGREGRCHQFIAGSSESLRRWEHGIRVGEEPFHVQQDGVIRCS